MLQQVAPVVMTGL